MTNGENVAASDALKPIRECGTCMLCCKLLDVSELNKPAGKWCVHAKQGIGCTIHATRPNSCKDFQCDWTTNPLMAVEWQPDKTKFFIFRSRPDRYDIVVDPGVPHAWKAPHYYASIKEISANYAEQGILVVVCIGRKRIVLLPHEDVDLGMQADGKELRLTRAAGPDGVTFSIEIIGEN